MARGDYVRVLCMKKVFSKEELPQIAQKIIKDISLLSSKKKAVFVTLSGNLGAGKTSLVQEIARQLGILDSVQSPTFVLMKKYEIPKKGTREISQSTLVHIDAYRIEDEKELRALNWETTLTNSQNLILLEWPEQIPITAQVADMSIEISHQKEARQISW